MSNANLSNSVWVKILAFLKTLNSIYIGKEEPAGNLSKPYFGCFEVVHNGDYCRRIEANGTVYTNVLSDGEIKAFGHRCIPILPMLPIWKAL